MLFEVGDIVLRVHRTWRPPCGYGQYVELIEQYPRVTEEFLKLSKQDQEVRLLLVKRSYGCVCLHLATLMLLGRETDRAYAFALRTCA